MRDVHSPPQAEVIRHPADKQIHFIDVANRPPVSGASFLRRAVPRIPFDGETGDRVAQIAVFAITAHIESQFGLSSLAEQVYWVLKDSAHLEKLCILVH